MTLPIPQSVPQRPPFALPALPLGLHRLPDDLAPSRAASWSFRLIIVTLAALIAWAGLTKLEQAASAPATLVPAGRLQVISHPQGGRLAAIMVRPGQRVSAGQPLLRLDPAQAQAQLGRNASSADALSARIARLTAEARGTMPGFGALTGTATANAETALFNARTAEARAAGAAAAALLESARRTLSGAEAEARARQSARTQADTEATLIAALVDKGLEPRISLDRARAAQAQAEAGTLAAEAGVARARAGVAQAEADLARTRDARRAEAAQALTLAQAEANGLAAERPALAGARDATLVRAPVAGTVSRVLVNTIGSAVGAGSALAELLPAGDRLEVDARLAPADIGFVHAGQKARIRITAYDAASFGAASGEVVRISPDAISDPRSGSSYYEVRIQLHDGPKGADGQPLALSAGMVAEVHLLGPPRSILAYLAAPFTRLQQTAFRER